MALPKTGVELVVKGSKDFFGTLDKAGGKVAGFGKFAAKAALAGTAAVGGFALAVGGVSVKAAIDFESAFAGVIKTTDGLVDSTGELTEAGAQMQQGFRDLAKEVPTTVEELLAIGELGGQLGIGREQLVGFTKSIAALGEATNLTTEEAATGFAQIANIMAVPREEAAQFTAQLGSSVVELGNNFATTERDILNFSQRIAGAGKIAGLSASDVAGIGAAFSSVGIEAEAGGTAVQKVLLGINNAVLAGGEELDIFAATAGLSADEFAGVWEKDAAGAFTGFVEGLGLAGDDAIAILSALGLEDQRLTRAFLSLAGSGDVLSDAIEASGDAFEDNTALTKEAESRYRTTESQFKIFKNTIKDLGITIGSALLPFVNDLIRLAQPLISELGQRLPGIMNDTVIPAIRTFAQILGSAIGVISGMVQGIQHLLQWGELLHPSEFIPGFFELPPTIQTIIEEAQVFLADFFEVWLPQAIEFAKNLWENVLYPAIQAAMPIIQNVVSFVVGVLGGLVAWFQGNIPLMRDTVETVLRGISNFWRSHGERITALVMTIWETIKTTVTNLINIVKNVIELVMNIIRGDWGAAWENIKGILESIWNIMVAQVELAIEQAKNIIALVLDAITSLWTADWTDIENILKTAWDEIKKTVNDGIKAARDIIEFIIESVVNIIDENWDSIVNLFNTGIEKAKGLLSAAVGAFQNAGRAVVDAVRSGIEAAWGGLVSWFKSKLDELRNMLPFSEPKDPNSPLRGLAQSGQAIVSNLVAGMDAATMQLQRAQLGMTSAVGGVAATQVASAPMSAMTNNTVNFNTSINNGMQASQFEQRVLRTVRQELR